MAAPGGVTAISTVAVQSGEARIILAVLRSTEWVRVKVHEMNPRMTEVGQNREEAVHLKAQHSKLVEQIAARQQQINALLTQGDDLVSTEQFYNDVYEAMAQALGEAWQDLNRQLQDRRNLLDEAIDFYQLSEDFSDKLKRASEESKSQEMPVGFDEAEARLNNHQALKKDILATSMKTMNLGRALIGHLNEMTPVDSPVEDRHATTTACFAIERTLESLQDSRRALEDAWNRRRQDLEQNIILCKLNKEVDKVSDWFKSYGDVHLDVGDSIEATRARLGDHEQLQKSFMEVQTKVSNMHVEPVKVSPTTQHKLQLLLTQTRGINTLCDDFAEKLNNWHQILTCTLDFRVHTQMAMETLHKVEIEIHNINKPREQLPRYSSTIHHAVDPVVREGQVLLSMLTYPTPGANHIQISIDKLQMEANRLDNQCLAERVHESTILTEFEERYSVVVRWLRNVGDNYLATYNDPGDQLATAMDFLEGHEQFDDDMREKTKEVEKVLNTSTDIMRSGSPDSASVQERADKLRQQWTRITISVENRIRIALILVKFHKLTKELLNAMENLETKLKAAINNESQPKSTSQVALQERWNHVIELYVQTESKGKNYLSEANFVNDDPLIVLQSSISTVEIKLKNYEEHKNKLADMYDSWQLNQTLSKDFASQWKQFVTDARQTIKWVERVEADFFPMSGELDGALHDTDSLQAKFDEIQLTMQRINAEIELRLKTAEMLSLKGDTEGEKEVIVTELLEVHQTLQGRIIELQILLTVSKSFFDNMRKISTLMTTTERSFKTAELPSNQTQKSVLLKQHEKCCEEIMTLYDSTMARGSEVIQRLQHSEKHAGSIQEVEESIKSVDDRKHQWLAKWHEHKDRLEGSLQDTQISREKTELMRDLGTIEHELKTIENDYGDSIHSVTLIVEKCEDIMINFGPLEKRCKTFISSAHMYMQQKPSSAADYAKDIDEVSSYLSTLHRQMDEKKRKLEIAVDVYETYELAVQWYNEGNKLLVKVAGDSQNVTKAEDATHLLDKVADFLQDGQNIQESRIDKLNQLTKQLYEGKPPSFVSELTFQNREMLKAFNEINDEVFVIAEKLQEKEYKIKQEEMQKLLMKVVPTDEGSRHAVVQQKPVPEESLAPFASPSKSTLSVREKVTAPYAVPVIEEKLQRKFIEEDKSTKEIKWPEKQPDEADIGITEITKTEVEFVPARVREELIEQAIVHRPVETVQLETLFRPIPVLHAMPMYEETLEITTDVVEPGLPYFSRVIRDMDITEGLSTVFECIVKGEPEPDVIWLKDDIQIDENEELTMEFGDDDSCILIFPSCLPHQAGTYTCKAFNNHGDATCSAVLTVKEIETEEEEVLSLPVVDVMRKPEFIEVSTKQIAEEGSAATITITVVGSPVPSVVWLKDGHNIDELHEEPYELVTDGDTHTLNISEVFVEDHGTFTCQAVNQAGMSHVDIQLEVKESLHAPIFIEKPKNAVIQESSSHTFECFVSGKPTPTIRWFKDRVPLEESSKFRMDFTKDVASLTINDATIKDSSTFTAEAKNCEGSVKTSAKLEVKEILHIPIFIEKPKNAVIQESSSHTFECFVSGKPTPTIKWLKDGIPLEESSKFRMDFTKDVASLTINDATIKDSSTFTAEAKNSEGAVKTSAKLEVKEILSAPVFIQKLKDGSVDESSSYTFECSVTGKPIPNVTWFKDGTLIKSSSRYRLDYTDGVARLTVCDVTVADSTTFTAEASNSQGSVTSTAHLEVKEIFSAPVFVNKLKNAVVEESSSHRFECSVIGKPAPMVEWFRDGNQIEENVNYKMAVIKGVASLTINEAKMDDTATFAAAASNTQGSVTTSASLVVKEILRAPVFFEKPKDAVVEESTSHRFECFVTGKPTPMVRWFRDSELLMESTGYKMEYTDDVASLTIVEVTMYDSTTFTTEASNSEGIVKTSAELEVKEILSAPVFIEKLRDVVVDVSSSERLECLVTGKPTPTVKWIKDGNLLEDSSKYEQDYCDGVASLIIHEVSVTDAATFAVEASNSKGTVRTSAYVEVREPKKLVAAPHFNIPLSKVDVDEGMSCKLSCFVISESEPTINWYKDRKPIDDSTDFEITYDQGMCCLFIQETFVEDSGRYDCKATNEGGQATTSGNLTVDAVPEDDSSPPHFVTKLGDVTVSSGERLDLTCTVTANPEPMVTWFHNGNQVEESENIKIIEDEERHMMVIREVSSEHSGTYIARASNHAGEDSTVSNIIVEELHTSMSGITLASQPKPAVPTILEEPPQDVEVVEGETVTINAHITGYPTPKVSWYKDEVIIVETEEITIVEDKHRCSLVFNPARLYHSGLYLYKAANIHGSLTGTCRIHIEDHTITSVTYPEAPTFTQTLMESISPHEGDTIRIQCRIQSSTQPQIRWTKDSRTIHETSRVRVTREEDVYCLIVIHVKPSDAGLYKITAITPMGQIESSTIIHVKAPQIVAPKFSIQLRDLHVTDGDEVKFGCQVKGRPTPEVTWYRRDEILEDDGDFKIIVNEDRHTLLIKEVFPEDSGMYKVVASNTAGQATSQAELVVECAPHVMRNLVDIEVREGEATQFECIITGNPYPVITWLLNGNPVSHDFVAESDGERHRLVIPEVFSDDDGLYTCIAENDLGQASTQAYLKIKEEIRTEIECETIERTESKTVSHTSVSLENSMPSQEPPQFSRSLKSVNTTEGQPVAFDAHVTGDPEPTVTWFRDNIDVSKCPDYDITIKDGVCSLKIEEAFPEDAGKFKVVAENAIGKASSTANLVVEELKEAPEFKKRLDNYEVEEGDRVEMETYISGYPRPMIRWYHNGEEIKSSVDINITQTGNTNKLTIPEVFEEDAGEYICKAENAAGIAQSIAELTVKRLVKEKMTVAVDSKQDEETAPEKPSQQQPTPAKVNGPAPPKPKVSPAVSSNLATFEKTPPALSGVASPKKTPPTPSGVASLKKTPPAPSGVASPKKTPQGPPELTPPKMTPPAPPNVAPPKKTPPAPPKVAPSKVTPPAPPEKSPPTFTKLLHDATFDEGSQAELTCHVTGKPEPEVKWKHEGHRIDPSLDFEISYKDGDAKLAIPEVFVDDAGRFTCSASNTEGERSTSCMLTVIAAEIPEMKGVQITPTFDSVRHPVQHDLLAPCFTKPLQPVKLVEGMRARFDCQVEGYPVPEIVWLMKGLPIAHGYRFIIKHHEQSGQCTLEITMALRDDIGEFTCIAKNQAGQTTTTAPLLPEAAYNRWFKEQQLERERKELEAQRLAHTLEMERQSFMASQPQPAVTRFVSPETEEVPVNPFEKRLMSEVAFRERSMSQDRISLHDKDQGLKLSPFERRLMTEVSYRERVTGDHDLERAHLAVDKDYMVSPFEARLAQEISFRDHSLGVDATDQPPAAPVAFDIDAFEAQLLNGSEFGTKDGTMTETDTETEFTESEMETNTDTMSAPRFVKETKNVQLMEGAPVTLSCRVSGRPRPTIQWFKDGYMVRKSQRLELRQTEGFCSLSINLALPDDSGHYTVLATNTAGKAVCSSRLLVKGSKGDDRPHHMKGIMGARVKMESKVYNMPDRGFIEGEVKEKYYRPAFKEIPQDLTVREGKVARFNCKVTGRPPPDFEWLRDGQPVKLNRNHQMIINEGGINSLVIYYTTPADAGVYTCTAKNRAGRNQFSVNLNVDAKERMVAPSFIDRIQNVAVKVNEPVTMQCKVTGTPAPTVSWQKDGHFIHPSDKHYTTEVKDGVCTLHIDEVQRWDAAWYSCTVLNSAGRTSCRAKLLVQVDKRPSSEPRQLIIPKRSPALPIVTDTMPIIPSYVQAESYSDEEREPRKAPAPKIEVQLHNITSNESASVSFKCRVAPSGDPTLKVEWFKDGQPIKSGSRYITSTDFGICTLTINGIFPDDAGRITCLITNESGTCQTTALLTCISKGTVILETQLPEEMQGIQKTLAYEQALREGTLVTEDETSEEDEHTEPSFVKVPDEVKCVEGGPARFSCRLTGYPLPRVSWYKDGVQLISSSRVKISFDGLHHLEIPKTRPYDAAEIKVEAKNKYGQVSFITKLQVLRREDYNIQLRPVSKEERTKLQNKFEEQRLAAKVGKPTTEQDRIIPSHAVKQEVIREEFIPVQQAELVPITVVEKTVTDVQEAVTEQQQQPVTVPLPVFSQELIDQVAVEGAPVVFEVKFTRNDEITIRWFKDGVDVHKNPDYSITVTAQSSKLTILESFTDDAGVFSVVLTSPAGTVKSAAQLFIREFVPDDEADKAAEPAVTETAPKLLSAPQEAVVGACGEPIKITIKIESEPKSQVTWFKGDQKLVPTIRQKMLEDDNLFTLLILDIKPEDAGTYYCEACNSSGVCRTEINIVVPASTGAPELVSPMKDVEVEEGCPIEIECHAISKPEPSITWFLDKAIIKPSKYFQMFYEEGVAKLYINEVFPEDEGQYACEVANEFGKVSSSARLRVKGMFYDAEYYAS